MTTSNLYNHQLPNASTIVGPVALAESTNIYESPPPLDSKEARTAMTKCLNALDDLTDDQRTRVVRAVAALYGIKLP
jgi:hypothetical protein